MEFHLEVVDGQPRAIFPNETGQRGRLLTHLLAPSPYYITILLWEVIRVEKREASGWIFDDSTIRITCTLESLVIEESRHEAVARDDLPCVELSLQEAKLLLWSWRFEHVKWEFQQSQGKVGGEIKMDSNIPHDEKFVERPVLFRVADRTGRHLGQAKDLVGSVRIVKQNRRRSESLRSFTIVAIYSDGTEETVLPEQYCRSITVSREDAIKYIKRRDDGIHMAKQMGISDSKIEILLGEQVERCDPNDPEEKQIADYISNAPEAWLTDEELRVEGMKNFRITNPDKQVRRARFVFSV